MELLSSPIWMILAKIILVIVMMAAGIVAFVVFFQIRSWQRSLALMEIELDQTRDMAMLHATICRAQLAAVTERIKNRHEERESDPVAILLSHAGPVISLLVNRNGSLLSWGMTAYKLGNALFSYFRRKNN